MDTKSLSSRVMSRVRSQIQNPQDEPIGLPKVNADKLADKLASRPSTTMQNRLLLVAAKLQKRVQDRATVAATTEVPATAAADALALDKPAS